VVKKIGMMLAAALAISPADKIEPISSASITPEVYLGLLDREAQTRADHQTQQQVNAIVAEMERLSPEPRPDQWDGTLCQGPIFIDGHSMSVDGKDLPIDHAILETAGVRQKVLRPSSIGYGLHTLSGGQESGAVLIPNFPSTLTIYVNDGNGIVFADRYWLGIHSNCRFGDREHGRDVGDGIIVSTG
jgi:hypothetical protein